MTNDSGVDGRNPNTGGSDTERTSSGFDSSDVARLLLPRSRFFEDARRRLLHSTAEAAAAVVHGVTHAGPVAAPERTLTQSLIHFQEALGRATQSAQFNDLGDVIARELMRLLNLNRVAIWQLDWQQREGRELARAGDLSIDLPEVIPFAHAEGFIDVLSRGEVSIMDGFPDRLNMMTMLNAGPDDANVVVLVVPIPPEDLPQAAWIGTRAPGEEPFSEADADLARLVSYHIGTVLRYETIVQSANRHHLHLEAMLEDFSGAVSVFDDSGRLTYVNEAEMELFDLEPEDCWPGQDLRDFLSRKKRLSLTGHAIPPDENPVARALRGERVDGVHQFAERKNGSRRYISSSARPIFVDGKLVGAVSTTRDLTVQRSDARSDENYLSQLENALRRSQAMADIVVEINENGSSLDLDVMSSFAIERICSEFNASAGALWLRSSDSLFHPAATHGFDPAVFAESVMEESDFAFSGRAVARNRPTMVQIHEVQLPQPLNAAFGNRRALLAIPMTVRGQRTGIAILGFDRFRTLDESDVIFASVWGRQCAQAIDNARLFEELEAAHLRLLAVLDQLPQAVVIVDTDGSRVLVANREADDLWGYQIQEGSDFFNLPLLNSDGDRLERASHPATRAVRGREQISGEPLIVLQPDGTQVEVIASHAPVMDGRGAVSGFVGVMQKRTDFKALDRSKDEFISVIAHELRNPLTSLRGNLQLLQRKVRKRADDQVEDELGRIDTAITQADRIGDLVSRMLDVSRVDMGSLDVAPVDADAAAILREVVDGWQSTDEAREVHVTAPESMPVVWDAARIHQVLSNLLQNAARHAPGSAVDISLTEKPGDRVELVVRDHGPGIPPKVRRRLFKQYYRFDDGQEEESHLASDGSRGLGIGMYVSARLIRQHGGTMSVHNHREGGAVFTIDLPRDASKDSAT